MSIFFFFSSRRRHTRCALVTGVQTCTLPICNLVGALPVSLDILKANYWLVPFSADDPLHTPNTLNVALPTVALAFGDAIKTVMTSDRKSVGEGKSVTVRVDLGGRRIIEKKKKHTQRRTSK